MHLKISVHFEHGPDWGSPHILYIRPTFTTTRGARPEPCSARSSPNLLQLVVSTFASPYLLFIAQSWLRSPVASKARQIPD